MLRRCQEADSELFKTYTVSFLYNRKEAAAQIVRSEKKVVKRL